MGSENNNNSKHNLYDIKLPFPFKLHEMLTECSKNGTEDIVSWQPHGKAFRVHKPQEFTDKIMQRFFHQSQYKSFQRQLHIYGFHRISKGRDKGSYYHPMFLKGSETISLRMTRCKIKGPMAHSETEDPDFYQEMAPSVGPRLELFEDPTYPPSTRADTNEDCACPMIHPLPMLAISQTKPTQEQEPPHQPIFHEMPLGVCPKIVILRDTFQPLPWPIKQLEDNFQLLPQGSFAPPPMLLKTLQDELPLSWNDNRRGSIFGDGDEVLFAGKKFHFVHSPV